MKATLVGAPKSVKLHAFAYPATAEEFNEIVEAAGGRENFALGSSVDCVKANIGDCSLNVYAPRDQVVPVRPKINAFIAAFLGNGEDGDES